MVSPRHLRVAVAVACLACVASDVTIRALTQQKTEPGWLDPFPPFRIAENVYYVGSKTLASYLVTTSQGHILINSDLEANVPLIRASVEQLGFKLGDVKILLINQSHWDHAAGSAMIKTLTGAKYMVMAEDVSVVESGGRTDFHYGGDAATHFQPTAVDRVLHDGDQVSLGDVVLTARLTPGHTKGCTTWTLQARIEGKMRSVVIIGGTQVNTGFKLLDNAAYPQIASDYQRTFRVLKSLACEVPLGAHGSYFDMEAKYERMAKGDQSAFIDPEGCRQYVAARERDFLDELNRQRAGQ